MICTHCYFYNILTFNILYCLSGTLLVLLLKNTKFYPLFWRFAPHFFAHSQKNAFLFYSVSTHYNVLTFFNKHFCSWFGKRLYLCSVFKRDRVPTDRRCIVKYLTREKSKNCDLVARCWCRKKLLPLFIEKTIINL